MIIRGYLNRNRPDLLAVAVTTKGQALSQTSPPMLVSLERIREYAEITVVPANLERYWQVVGYNCAGRREVIVDHVNSKAVAEAWVRNLADMVVSAELMAGSE